MNAIEILKSRYACKHYDSSRDVSDEAFSRILEAGRLTPSAMNVQPWHIYVFDRASKDKIRPAILDFNLDRYAGAPEIKGTVHNARKAYVAKFKGEKLTEWTGKQAYIMLGTLLYAAACEQVDATPVEGFDPAKADELLGLAGSKETAQLVVLFGYRKNDGNADRPKSRLPLDRIVTKI